MSQISGFKQEIKDLHASNKKFKYLFGLFVFALIAIPSFLYTRTDNFNKPSPSSEVLGTNNISLDEVNDLLEKVKKLADVPSEIPNVATVSDINALRSQPFFNKAENGDKVLIFQQAKRAILYRPSTNKIIEYSAIVVEQESPTPVPINITATPSGEAEASPTIILQRVNEAPTTTPTKAPAQVQ